MYKKFSTLIAGLLLACTFVGTVNAQVLTATGPIKYRQNTVLATALDGAPIQNVYKIDKTYWYQLVVSPTKDGVAQTPTSTFVLTQVRTANGELKLQAAPLPKLTEEGTVNVTASLNSSLWKIVSAETGTRGVEYTFQNKETGAYLSYNLNSAIKTETTLSSIAANSVYTAYAATPVNAYDQARWLWYSDADNGTVAFDAQKIYAYTHKDKSLVVGLAVAAGITNATAPVDVVPVQVPASAASKMSNVNFLAFTVVNAGVKVLNAAEINGMINSDEEANGKLGASFKSTPAINNVLFNGKYTAEDVAANTRGYNVKLNAGNSAYLAVNQDTTYEAGKNPTEHGGLLVTNQRIPENATDAATARFIWKVTYYPTPDSLVLEPYNASFIGTLDAQNNKKWMNTDLKSATSDLYYNTVNKGVAHANGEATATTNVPFGKKAFVPVALTIMNVGKSTYDTGLVLTVGQSTNAAIATAASTKPGSPVIAYVENSSPVQYANMGMKIQFANKAFAYLTPVTVAKGLYFINLYDPSAQTDARTDGANVVCNMAGWMMYDKPAKDQNYNIMPATMWVVDQDSCFDAATPTINIANREYGRFNPAMNWKPENYIAYAFQGQLYQVYDENGKAIAGVYRMIDPSYPTNIYPMVNKYGKFSQETGEISFSYSDGTSGYMEVPLYQKLHFNEAYTFTKVTDAVAKTTTHGYKAFASDLLNDGTENRYYLKYNNFDNDNLYLKSAAKTLSVTTDTDSTLYEIGEAVIPTSIQKVYSTKYYTVSGAIQDPDFGWNGASNGAALQKLNRYAYTLKVKDDNLLDNDKLYVTYAKNPTGGDEMWYYTTMKLSDIESAMMDNTSSLYGTAKWAPFYLKADQMHAGVDTSYVLVDIFGTSDRIIIRKGLTKSVLMPYGFYTDNGWAKANVVDGLGNLRYSDLDENPADRASAFYTQQSYVRQYVDLSLNQYKGVNGLIKIYRTNGTAKEYLFEDKMDQSGVLKTTGQTIKSGLGYLAIEGKGVAYNTYKGHAALYVDPVYKGIDSAMPTYLLCVAPDSVPDGYVCKTGVHGYWATKAEADTDLTHYVPYNGYVAARYLVNLQDSVDNNIYMLEKANMFKWQDYTRLAFLEGIHQVDTTGGKAKYEDAKETLYLLKDGYKLSDYYNVVNKSFKSGYNPGYVLNQYGKDEKGNKITKTPSFVLAQDTAFSAVSLPRGLNTKVTWSFRKTNENASYGADASEPFLMESWDGNKDHQYAGMFEGAWVKVQNGIPVIAQINNGNGNHEGESGLLNEVVNQAQIFRFETTTETPTSAVAVSVSNINVLAGEGNVQILNAAGKKVVVTNILGQTVASEVLSSDNATIAAPAGVVVVAIEGAKAVKAIVK